MENPAELVEGMNAVVAQFAGAVVPHPMPSLRRKHGRR
jgi:hypothetical protein